MGSRLARLLLALTLTVSIAAAARAEDTPAQKAVRDRRAEYSRAMNAHNINMLAVLLDPSLSVKSKSGRTQNLQQFRGLMTSEFQAMRGLKYSASVDSIAVKKDTATLAAGETLNFVDPKGHKHEIKRRVNETWKQVGGKWMLVIREEH